MANLKVRNSKTGEEREMTERSFQLAGSKRGFTVIGKVETPAAAKSEVQKIMDQKIAERAAQQAAKDETKKLSDLPQSDELAKDEVVIIEKQKAKPGPKPKTV